MIPSTLIIGSVLYEREDLFKLRLAEEDSFKGMISHISNCKKCRQGMNPSTMKIDESKLCPNGKKLWARWSQDSSDLEKSGASKPKKRQPVGAQPIPVKRKHPHKGPVCIKKDPGGRCLKWDRFKPGRKSKPKRMKTPKWS
jgi:hypothetical protein